MFIRYPKVSIFFLIPEIHTIRFTRQDFEKIGTEILFADFKTFCTNPSSASNR
jgi:hypothetical protein